MSGWDLVFVLIDTFIHYKVINLDSITNENNKEHNEKWWYIPDHRYRIFIIGGSGWGKTNTLLSLIKEQDNIDKIYLYPKDLSESKYEFLIEKREDVGTNHFNDPNAFIECSNTMDDVYQNIDDYNPSRKIKILIVFDDMIADIMSNKKDVRLNSTHYLIMKINNKRELQNIATNHSADISYKDFLKIYREWTRKPYSFLTNDTTLPASDPLRFKTKLFSSCKNDSNWSD